MRTSPVSPSRARKILTVAVLAALFGASACTHDKAAEKTDEASTTEPKATTTAPDAKTGSSPTTTTTKPSGVDPTRLPVRAADVTPQYAEAVLTELGDRLRNAYVVGATQDPKLTERFRGALSKAFTGVQIAGQITSANKVGAGAAMATSPPPVKVAVRKLYAATTTCFFASADFHIEVLLKNPPSLGQPFFIVARVPATPTDDPMQWRLALVGRTRDNKPPEGAGCDR